MTDRPYLMDVPIVKFLISQALDIFLTINLTFPLFPANEHFGERELLYAKVRLLSGYTELASVNSPSFRCLLSVHGTISDFRVFLAVGLGGCSALVRSATDCHQRFWWVAS